MILVVMERPVLSLCLLLESTLVTAINTTPESTVNSLSTPRAPALGGVLPFAARATARRKEGSIRDAIRQPENVTAGWVMSTETRVFFEECRD